MIWGQLKQRIRRKNTGGKFSNEMLLKNRHEAESVDAWRNTVVQVLDIENRYRANHVQELIIKVNRDFSSESDSE